MKAAKKLCDAYVEPTGVRVSLCVYYARLLNVCYRSSPGNSALATSPSSSGRFQTPSTPSGCSQGRSLRPSIVSTSSTPQPGSPSTRPSSSSSGVYRIRTPHGLAFQYAGSCGRSSTRTASNRRTFCQARRSSFYETDRRACWRVRESGLSASRCPSGRCSLQTQSTTWTSSTCRSSSTRDLFCNRHCSGALPVAQDTSRIPADELCTLVSFGTHVCMLE
jgi:hypothetical protein